VLVNERKTNTKLDWFKNDLFDWIVSVLLSVILPVLILWLGVGWIFFALPLPNDIYAFLANDRGILRLTILCAFPWLLIVLGMIWAISTTKSQQEKRQAKGCFYQYGIGLAIGIGFMGIIIQLRQGEAITPLLGRIGPDLAIVNEVSQVCKGNGLSQAAPYTGGPGLHPIVLLDESGGINKAWTNSLPHNWLPESLNSIELVACVKWPQRKKLIETCRYQFAASIERYRYEVKVRLIAAQTGKTLGTVTLTGASPRNCQQTERRGTTTLEGDHVSFQQVKKWLTPFVEVNK